MDENKEFTDGLTDGLSMQNLGDNTPEGEKPPEGGKPPEGEKPPEEGKPPEGEKPPEGGKPPEGEKPPEGGKPPEGEKPPQQKPEDVITPLLNEMFGGRYKSLDEVKEADIPGQLEELSNLREANKILKEQAENPIAGYANESIGKYDQFVKDTGIDNWNVYDRLERADLDNMKPEDLMVLKRIVDNPTFIGRESKVRQGIVKEFDVDPKKVEEEELTQDELETNQLNLESASVKAKKELGELKAKIRLPDKPEQTPENTDGLTKEELEERKNKWGNAVGNMIGSFQKLKINPDGTEEPLFNYEIPEESKKGLTEFAVDYVLKNRLEFKEENAPVVSKEILKEYLFTNFNSVLKAIIGHVTGKTKEEVEETYHNPSSKRNDDQPDEFVPEEDAVEQAFKAEMGE